MNNPQSAIKPKRKVFFTPELKAKLKPNLSTLIVAGLLVSVLVVAGGWIVYLYWQNGVMNNQVLLAQEQELFQKKQKQQITDIWEEQAAINDDLVSLQAQALSQSVTYQTELLKNFRFVNNEPQANNGQDIDKLRQAEDKLYNTLSDINLQIDKNSKKKQELKDKVDTIYKQADEEQQRRANPRDGLRQ